MTRDATVPAAAVSVMAALSALAFAGMSAPGPALAFSMIAGIAVIVLAFSALGGYNNILFIFLVFHLLYGVSGPVNALYGEPLSPLFSMPYETAAFLGSFALATAGMAIAILVGSVRTDGSVAQFQETSSLESGAVLPLALALAAFASCLEGINLARVGVGMVFEGKAVYQSAVDDLVLTAPSYEMAKVAICLLALGLAQRARRRAAGLSPGAFPYGRVFFLLLSPLVLLSLVLGRRGPLLDWISVLFIGTTWYVSRRRVSRIVVVGTLATYLALGLIYANRASLAYAMLTDDYSSLTEHVLEPENIVTALNPGANEFGAAFGNFSEYEKYDVAGPQYGRTYVEGFALVAPSFLYPGTKPQPVALEFRDRFFPGLADEGAIAGTAYSSVLEAYVNFREPGVFVVYLLFGLGLMWLERRRRTSGSLVFALIYLSMVPAAIVFHRADFGAAVIAPMFFAVILSLVAAGMVIVFDRMGLVTRDPSAESRLVAATPDG